MTLTPVLMGGAGAMLGVVWWARHLARRREAFIRRYEFPPGLMARLQARRPELNPAQLERVGHGLRQFFLVYLASGCRFVSMPSQVVDDLWHEFILYTRHYQQFCRRAFGGFLHHRRRVVQKAVVLGPDRRGNAGLRRCWWHACRLERLDPRAARRLPLLFGLDASLGIAGGFHYVPDCGGVRRERGAGDGGTPYCGADFASSSFDGGADGFGVDGASSGHGGHHGDWDGGGHGPGGDGGGDSIGADGGGGGDGGSGGCTGD
ncbi:glycine-rich domain-containing protein [Ideonella oryzae]|uniref:Uncharacterized protein n=1 Tax=Ideonella oryzae TaxID=2937441 RepID=A0ABT1BSH2_9BURK|nr:hypothetical protein [Ideonella oryzae]MCO5979156.1 hypothetical protein [Ideonella oryzae]